jgi:hypothetical protein
MDFIEFPKIARLSRDVVITEKLDGTNAQVLITPIVDGGDYTNAVLVDPDGHGFAIFAGSRNRFVTQQADNYGFAKWVYDHAYELAEHLGEGQHFGEWWGRGIQRNYSQTERHFSLFNTKRWGSHRDHQGRVGPCRVVPTLYSGPMEDHGVMKGLQKALTRLQIEGSVAAPGFMKPEGVVVYHKQANQLFKKTLERDEEPKGKSQGDRALAQVAHEIAESYPDATKNAEGGR